MTFNVDECLADIWLQTVRLRQGEQFATGEGRRLWQMCADNVTCVREVTRTAGLLETFLDIFNHRILTQFYRIWRKYSYPATFEAGGAIVLRAAYWDSLA